MAFSHLASIVGGRQLNRGWLLADQLQQTEVGGLPSNLANRDSHTPAVSIVVPAFNEQDAVGATITSVRQTLDAAGIAHFNSGTNDFHWNN